MGRHSLYNKVITEFIIVAVMLLMLWLIELHNRKMDQRRKKHIFYRMNNILFSAFSTNHHRCRQHQHSIFIQCWWSSLHSHLNRSLLSHLWERLDFSPMKYDNVFNDWVSEYTSVYIYTRWFTISLVHIIIQ